MVNHSGAAALELARSNLATIGVALVDVRMPGMTGPELGNRLADMEVPFKVLYMSGFAPEHVPVRDGVRTILEKPFSRSELLKRVEQVLST